jgi:hypothetical protein
MANLKHQGFTQVAYNDIFQFPSYLMIYIASNFTVKPRYSSLAGFSFINTNSSHNCLYCWGIKHYFLSGPGKSTFRNDKNFWLQIQCVLYLDQKKSCYVQIEEDLKTLIQSLCVKGNVTEIILITYSSYESN